MNFLIITGMSGAGKSNAIKCLEDLDYYCIDNMPPILLPKFAELCGTSQGRLSRVAVVCDIRGGELFDEFYSNLEIMKHDNYDFDMLFLEASDETIVKRYKETRRKHPIGDDRVVNSIVKERELLKKAKTLANYIIDTSTLSPAQLRSELSQIFTEKGHKDGIMVNVVSFGFKYGIPMDCDLVFDVRFLPNPYYIPDLKPLSGLNKPVSDYVMSFKQSGEFLAKLTDLIGFLLPQYVEEGKSQLVIGIGCTGGKHRSVTLAEELYKFIREQKFRTTVIHRDYQKDRIN